MVLLNNSAVAVENITPSAPSDEYKRWTTRDWMVKIIEMRRKNEDFNSAQNSDGQTILMCATEYSIINIMQQILLARDARGYQLINIDAKDNNGNTALSIAAIIGDKEKMLLLLRNGADINMVKSKVRKNHKEVEDLDYEVEDACSLIITVLNSRKKEDRILVKTISSILKKYPVPINRDFIVGDPILLDSLAFQRKEIAKLLLKQPGIDINKQGAKGRTALMLAIYKGYDDIVKLLLEKPIDVNIQDEEGETALLYALDRFSRAKKLRGYNRKEKISPTMVNLNVLGIISLYEPCKKIIQMLLERDDIDVNISAKNGDDALMLAALSGDEKIVDSLIKKGAIVDLTKSRMDLYFLSKSFDFGGIRMIDLLSVQENNVDVRDDMGHTMLMRLAVKGFTGACKMILDKGADINAIDNVGNSALMYAIWSGHKGTVKLLLDRGAKVNILDRIERSVLVIAIVSNNKDIIKLLLNRYSLKELCFNIKTLIVAVYSKDEEILDLLFQHGVSAEMALHASSYLGDEKIVNFLLNKNIDFNQRSFNGYTALIFAAEEGHARIVNMLINLPGIDINAKNSEGETALDCAERKGRRRVIRLIQSKIGIQSSKFDQFPEEIKRPPIDKIKEEFWNTVLSGDINEMDLKFLDDEGEILVDVNSINENGDTALIIAASNGNLELVRWLMEYNADITIKDANGDNALIRAAKNGYFDVVEELLYQKANIISVGQYKRTALMVAAENGYVRVVKLLLKKGVKTELKDDYDKTALDIVKEKIKEISNINGNYETIKKALEDRVKSFNINKDFIFNEDINASSWEVSIDKCKKDLKSWEKDDPNVYNRIQMLIEDIKSDPFRGLGRVERLTGDLEGQYSRRINKQNRLVYEVDGEKVILKLCKGHYEHEKR